MTAFVPVTKALTQAEGNSVAVGAQSKHKFLMRLFIPGKGYKYIYPPGSSISRVPQPAPMAAPQQDPNAPQQDGQQPPDDGTLTAAPPRQVPRSRGHAGRNFLGDGGVPTLSVPAHEFWDAHRDDVRDAIILLLHEHCALADLGDVWAVIKPHLDELGDKGVRLVLQDQKKAEEVYRLGKGVAHIAAHLLVVDNWQSLCHGLPFLSPEQADHLASIARPRGGWPLFDSSLRELSARRYDIHD